MFWIHCQPFDIRWPCGGQDGKGDPWAFLHNIFSPDNLYGVARYCNRAGDTAGTSCQYHDGD